MGIRCSRGGTRRLEWTWLEIIIYYANYIVRGLFMDIVFASVFFLFFRSPFDSLLLLLHDDCNYFLLRVSVLFYFIILYFHSCKFSKEFSRPSLAVVGRVGLHLCAALVRKLGMIPVLWLP